MLAQSNIRVSTQKTFIQIVVPIDLYIESIENFPNLSCYFLMEMVELLFMDCGKLFPQKFSAV